MLPAHSLNQELKEITSSTAEGKEEGDNSVTCPPKSQDLPTKKQLGKAGASISNHGGVEDRNLMAIVLVPEGYREATVPTLTVATAERNDMVPTEDHILIRRLKEYPALPSNLFRIESCPNLGKYWLENRFVTKESPDPKLAIKPTMDSYDKLKNVADVQKENIKVQIHFEEQASLNTSKKYQGQPLAQTRSYNLRPNPKRRFTISEKNRIQRERKRKKKEGKRCSVGTLTVMSPILIDVV